MRVIGGSARGRTLKGPPPRETATRPTSDMVRGVIFDMLDAMGTDYDRVLDLYAGTGALGIEALSRGDGTADFVEADAAAARLIDANLAAIGFASRARVHRRRAEQALSSLSGPYTLVLADPPYYDDGALAAVEQVAASPLLAEGAVLVLEHGRRQEPAEMLGKLTLYRSRRHGDSVVSIYREEESA
ncbi:MAG: 16S rRNA (guanine(966)-N(2))-methyltransferase RsmD [Dehalococcoidia bacterium]